MSKVVLIGSETDYGQFFTRVLREAKYDVTVVKSENHPNIRSLVEKAWILIFAIPAEKMERVVYDLAGCLPARRLWLDIASTKVPVSKAFDMCIADSMSLRFDPDFLKSDIKGLPLNAYPLNIGTSDLYVHFLNFLAERLGAELKIMQSKRPLFPIL